MPHDGPSQINTLKFFRIAALTMSALGHKQTFRSAIGMAALPLIAPQKADIYPANGHVCFPPKADIAVPV